MQSNDELNNQQNHVIPSDTSVSLSDTIGDTENNTGDTLVSLGDTVSDTQNQVSDTAVSLGDTASDTQNQASDTAVSLGDTVSDTQNQASDTAVSLGDTASDTQNQASDTAISLGDTASDTQNQASDTAVSLGDTVSDTEIKVGDTTSDTKVSLGDTAIDTIVSVGDTEVSLGDTDKPKDKRRQISVIRLKEQEIEVLEAIAQKLTITPYELSNKIVSEFLKSPLSQNPINEDVIRKDEESKCAERTESLMKSFMPITTHEKELRDLTDLHESELKDLKHELSKVQEIKSGIENSEEFKILKTHLIEIRACIKFFRELELLENKIYPESFIASYNGLRQKLRTMKEELDNKHEAELRENTQKLKETFVKILQDIVDLHTRFPFVSGEGLFDQGVQRLNTI